MPCSAPHQNIYRTNAVGQRATHENIIHPAAKLKPDEIKAYTAKIAELSKPMDEHAIDVLYAAGPLMNHLWEKTPAAKRGAYAANSTELKDSLLAQLRSGDVVMVKGSLGSRMGILVDALRVQFAPIKKES